MPNLIFRELTIASPLLKKAKIIKFHPKRTVLVGENKTGKSTILKSIFYCFGAESANSDNNWHSLNPQYLMKFSVGVKNFEILRTKSMYALFDSTENKTLAVSRKLTGEIINKLSNILDYKFRLIDKSGQLVVPPSAFLFLPYYFDQDNGWRDKWEGFANLGQFSNWRNNLINYHSGIHSNEYFDLKSQSIILAKKQAEENQRLQTVKGVKDQIKDRIDEIGVVIDLAAFEEEVNELLENCGKLQASADIIRDKLVQLHNQRIDLDGQIKVVEGTLVELNKDFQYLANKDSSIVCPTCNAEHDSSFGSVFKIELNESRCTQRLLELREQRRLLKSTMDEEQKLHEKLESKASRIQAILQKKRDNINLEDVIESESRRRVRSILNNQVKEINNRILEIYDTIREMKKRIRELDNKEHKEKLKGVFSNVLSKNKISLHLSDSTLASTKAIYSKIKAQGSELPRGVLAYGFAFLNLMRRNPSSAFCPVVVDSPLQQEPDRKYLRRVLEFLRDEQPTDSQMILAVVNTDGIEFGGLKIEMKNAESALLQSEEYDQAMESIQPLLNRALMADFEA